MGGGEPNKEDLKRGKEKAMGFYNVGEEYLPANPNACAEKSENPQLARQIDPQLNTSLSLGTSGNSQLIGQPTPSARSLPHTRLPQLVLSLTDLLSPTPLAHDSLSLETPSAHGSLSSLSFPIPQCRRPRLPLTGVPLVLSHGGGSGAVDFGRLHCSRSCRIAIDTSRTPLVVVHMHP
ncbi:hypothetical protein CRG98_033558 [Punica granatum]|uniref:Uncharacterized protein n=1 Tax=Punica granatum TaxID=22663 RepID=A0A2I0IPW5_PUNGR|nr:hypothetical protein CRG98_033558 [Punica granatum]